MRYEVIRVFFLMVSSNNSLLIYSGNDAIEKKKVTDVIYRKDNLGV